MRKIVIIIPAFFAIFLVYVQKAAAYIDPGSGGYLFGSIIAMIAGFFAVASAFIIHFFRNIIGKRLAAFRNKHRALSTVIIAAIVLGAGALAYRFFYEPAVGKFNPSLSGAHIRDVASISPGYNLYEGKLIDLKGKVVKQWSSINIGTLDGNGDYYAQKYFEAPLWGRYTWDDKVVWEKNFPVHHEILLTPQGTIFTLTKEVHDYQGRNVEFDVILEFDKDGKELQRFSFWDHLKDFQRYHAKLELDMPPTFIIPENHRKTKSVWGGNYDYYHMNSFSLIPKNSLELRHRAFRPGNWLISMRHGSMIFILDQDTKKVLWRAIDKQVKDRLEGPHTPSMLSDGNILLFDNGRYRKWSRVLVIDPVTLKVVWEYRDKNFYTLSQGSVQRLPNGNMLVTEAEEGYVFEITPDKRTVWEFYNPEKQIVRDPDAKKRSGGRQEIYRMTRIPEETVDRLLSKGN